MKQTIQGIITSLSAPRESFQGEAYWKASRFALFALLFLCFLSSSLLSHMAQQTPEFKAIQFEMALKTAEKQMVGATEDQRASTRENIRQQMDNPVMKAISLVSLVVVSFAMLLRVLILWGLISIVSRFLGGEETPLDGKKHRRTLYMVLYATIPVAISYVLSGLMMALKDPSAYANALTMKEYVRAMSASPNLYYLFAPTSLELWPFVEYLLKVLTDPFHWWAFIILFVGMKSLLRLNGAKCVFLLSLSVVVFGTFTAVSQSFASVFGG
ncbi:MAG: YIP1 family protein [Spirochaetales bacterium]|nr:YIP1 family protein [Spirochaetales bacterium]